jgi:hypothetical protein
MAHQGWSRQRARQSALRPRVAAITGARYVVVPCLPCKQRNKIAWVASVVQRANLGPCEQLLHDGKRATSSPLRREDTHLSTPRGATRQAHAGTEPSAACLAQQLVFDGLHLVPEVLQLLCQGHFGLGQQLTLFVLDMPFHREA